jgi:hypothetical protein
MEMVGMVEGTTNKVWYRCPKCRHAMLLNLDDLLKEAELKSIPLNPELCVTYSPLRLYSVGEAIFHTELNDVGKVTRKVRTSDGHQAIIVTFEKIGERRLIENFLPEEDLQPGAAV